MKKYALLLISFCCFYNYLYASPKIYYMILAHDGRALDGGRVDKLVYTHEKPNLSNEWHLWKLVKSGNGQYMILAHDGRALDGGRVDKLVYTHEKPDSNNEWHLWIIKKIIFPDDSDPE